MQEYFDTIGFRMHNSIGFPNEIHSDDISFLTDYVLNKTDSRFFVLDWEQLNKYGINSISTFSEITINEEDNYGLIGIQQYTKENFKMMTKYVELGDSIVFHDLWEGDFKILDLKCQFIDQKLSSFEPNSMIIN